ncbi:hypothetical protein P8C59_006618 [Phyllachora maydis]|uniref:Transcription elongation factor 1 homolog n=1 Tax=Phyllachora maydis TaxID=1825666 RepID=A0AAD9I7V0_9PEZI|nr:hypothetical protein P8C59_006618 [Phyllachora maydis]
MWIFKAEAIGEAILQGPLPETQMGKRKSAKKPQGPRKQEPLPTVFTCLFCNHEKSVSVKMDKKAGVGELDCKICGQRFQCGINYLSAPIDVYSEWVDAADAVAGAGQGRAPSQHTSESRPVAGPNLSRKRSQVQEEEGARYEGDGIVADDDDFD